MRHFRPQVWQGQGVMGIPHEGPKPPGPHDCHKHMTAKLLKFGPFGRRRQRGGPWAGASPAWRTPSRPPPASAPRAAQSSTAPRGWSAPTLARRRVSGRLHRKAGERMGFHRCSRDSSPPCNPAARHMNRACSKQTQRRQGGGGRRTSRAGQGRASL